MSVDIEEVEIVDESIDEFVDMTPILIKDLGSRFIKEDSKRKSRMGLFKCQHCGEEFEAHIEAIKSGLQKSCGCLRGERHKGSKGRLYKIWKGIKRRCICPTAQSYKNYGGRGITICDEWKNSYISFRDWSIDNGYSDELSIDRVDNEGNYEPDNCRWTTREIQARNKRRIQSNNTSGFRGVYWGKQNSKWIAKIRVNNKDYTLGAYDKAIDGAIAYNNYVIENNLEHTLNIIPEEVKEESND